MQAVYSVGDIKDFEQVADMRLDGCFGNKQCVCHFLVTEPLVHQTYDFNEVLGIVSLIPEFLFT